jgi:tRNA modification GTPase
VRDPSETIVAVATPGGRGAIAIVRASGPEAARLVEASIRGGRAVRKRPRRPFLADFVDAGERILDRVLVTFFPAPNSYTGQDVVEISCHGSPIVTRGVLETLIERGMRLAEPGEFTLRAFLNGKLDLAQAEAVRDLVNSQTEFQARVAREQLSGSLARALAPVRAELLRVICHLETAVEFGEEGVSTDDRRSLGETLGRVARRVEALEASFAFGRLVQEGAVVTIVGRPNAGKSSLFNALLEEERAIVTEVPGTTRDALRESINLNGIPGQLVDTAGIRESEDPVERLGVDKSLEYLRRSDAVCFVVDGSLPFGEEDWAVWEAVKRLPCVLAINKSDLRRVSSPPDDVVAACAATLEVSATLGANLEALREALARVTCREAPSEGAEALVTSMRQRDGLRRARERIGSALKAEARGLSEEFALYDLRGALEAVGEVTGATSVEELLDGIFSTFCIGK